MRKCSIRFIYVNRYSPGFNDPKRAGKWFWELHGDDGTVWGMGDESRSLVSVVEKAETFRCFSGLPLRMSPFAKAQIKEAKSVAKGGDR